MESLTGCQIFKNICFSDERGHFIEAYKRSSFSIPPIRQTNISKSTRHTVRGLHFQRNRPQGKLVRVADGMVLDVVVDLRVGSPTYGKVEQFLLTPEGISVYVPPGFAHGFWCLSETAIFHYGCTEEWDSESDSGIHPMDPELSLPWRNRSNLIFSEKDQKLPFLKDFKSHFRF